MHEHMFYMTPDAPALYQQYDYSDYKKESFQQRLELTPNNQHRLFSNMEKQTSEPVVQRKNPGLTHSVQSKGQPVNINKLIGSVMILPNQLIHIYDERIENGCVRLVCKDPQDLNGMLWQYLVTTYDKTAPVVMANVTIRDKETNVVAFAVGRRVFLARFHFRGHMYDSVESIFSLKVDDVITGSWISCINAHYSSGSKLKFDLLISIGVQNEIRGCLVTGEVVKEIKPREELSLVTSIASSGDVIAIIHREFDHVRLLVSDITTKACGSLIPVKHKSCQRPVSVIWTGSMWMVLWVGQERSKVWMISTYKHTGELIKFSVSSSQFSDGDEPISLARFGNTGFVSFKNHSIKLFQF
ncbi:uncharacterized protein [Apostichopus japonicus]